jgi:hypothetical protein
MYVVPSAAAKLPSPSIFPAFQLPSYRAPFAHAKIPLPLALPALSWPWWNEKAHGESQLIENEQRTA